MDRALYFSAVERVAVARFKVSRAVNFLYCAVLVLNNAFAFNDKQIEY